MDHLYPHKVFLLNKRIGYPLMVNSRSEYGVQLNSPNNNVNQAHFDKDILSLNKNQRNPLPKLGQKGQTNSDYKVDGR